MVQKKPVPPYKWNGGSFNPQQSGFFRRWKNAWNRGEVIDIEGQIDYLSYYVYFLTLEPPYEAVLNELLHIRNNYGYRVYRLHNRISDCYILLNRYEDALKTLKPHIQLGTRQESFTSHILSLKLITGDRLEGKDILSLYGPKLTAFGKEHIEKIAECLDMMIDRYERENDINLIAEWAKTAHTFPHRIGNNIRMVDGYTVENIDTELKLYSFRDCLGAQAFTKEITRLAENIVREEASLPHVGAGWLSEMKLYQLIKKALPNFDVEDHSSPSWLGIQHLDIFIPELKIALEYQGKQHDEPVEYFGGQEAFEKTQERDARKKRLCIKHGIHIVYVRPGYKIDDVLDEIRAYSVQEISFEDSNLTLIDTASSIHIKDTISDKLLQIDAKKEPETISYEYELPPDLYIEPIRFDPDYKVSPQIPKRHLALANQMEEIYKQRNNDPNAIDKVIDLCKQQIELSFDMAQYYYQDCLERRDWCLQQADKFSDGTELRQHYLQAAENNMKRKTYHFGYRRLVIIYEKQHQFEEALKLAIKAKSEHWDEDGYWDEIIVRLLAHMGK